MKYSIILSLLVLMCSHLSAQDVASYFFQQQDCVQEKLSLSFDRPYYEPGDTVWFRGTLVAADNLSYLIKSNYIHVELIDRYGRVLSRRKVKRDGLCFQHNMPLDSVLQPGAYMLRAYTSWMRNFNDRNFCSRTLTVVNPNASTATASAAATDFTLAFYPEGGNFVAGTTQTVAFRACTATGAPIDVAGELLSATTGERIATFSSTHDGMGSCRLTTTADRPLKAVVNQAGGVTLSQPKEFALPEISAGYALQCTTGDTGTEVRYRVLAAPTAATDSLLLVLHAGARLAWQQVVAPGAEGVVDLAAGREGVNQLLLCSRSGITLSRRLLYRMPQAERRATVQQVQLSGATDDMRAPLDLSLLLTDAAGNPLRGDFAISLIDGDFVDVAADRWSSNTETELLLTNDLAGHIFHPAWYLSAQVPEAERRRGAELLMLTHGWSRFDTDTLRESTGRALTYPLEEHEWISGNVRLNRRSERKDASRIAISVVDTAGGSWGTAMLDSAGGFFVGDLDYPNNTPLYIRILSYSSQPHYVFDRYEFPDVTMPPALCDTLQPETTSILYERWLSQRWGVHSKLLDDVVVTRRAPGRGSVTYHQTYDAPTLAQNYDLYTYPRALDLLNEVIRHEDKYIETFDFNLDGKDLAGITEINYSPSYPFSNYQGTENQYQPQIYLRNVEHRLYTPLQALEKLYSEDIAKIEFFQRDSNYVVVTFNPGTEISDVVRNKREVKHYAYGYTLPQYFHHPQYATAAEREYPNIDGRKTLYWNPSVQTSAAGKLQLHYYSSDHVATKLHLRIEGVTFDGRPVSVRQDISL
jgi:hypothetical protein